MATTRLLSAMVATWNNVATTFTGLKLNVTDTASASGSLLMDLQADGVSKFRVGKGGFINVPANQGLSAGATGYSDIIFGGLDGTGGVARIEGGSGAVYVRAAAAFGFSSTVDISATPDVVLRRDAANTLALRNGTAGQSFRAYNTYTDASNSEWADFTWTGNQFYIGTGKNGTGSSRQLNFVVGSSVRWAINTNGHFIAATDNTYDIGASGANRPRNLYLGGALTTGDTITSGSHFTMASGGQLSAAGGSALASPANGNWLMRNNAGTDFGLLQFGGTTSSFPALKRNGSQLIVRLADDSGNASLQASFIDASAYISAGTYVKSQSTTVAGLTAAATAGAGARSFVTDATATTFLSTVAGGGANKVPVVSDGTNWLIG